MAIYIKADNTIIRCFCSMNSYIIWFILRHLKFIFNKTTSFPMCKMCIRDSRCSLRSLSGVSKSTSTSYAQSAGPNISAGILSLIPILCPNFCPRYQLKTGIGVRIFPEGAYPGSLRLCPPACSKIRFSAPNQFEKDSLEA